MNLQNHNLTKMQTKRQRTHNPISKLYTNLNILNGKKDIKQQNKTSRTPKEKLKVNGNLMAQMPPENNVTVHNLQERNSQEIVVQISKCFWVK